MVRLAFISWFQNFDSFADYEEWTKPNFDRKILRLEKKTLKKYLSQNKVKILRKMCQPVNESKPKENLLFTEAEQESK